MRRPGKRCPTCGSEAEGYRHEPDGCGLTNMIRLDVAHDHYYCPRGHEWTEPYGR